MAKIKVWFAGLRQRWADTYFKRIVTFLTVNAAMWIWASYILAWYGRAQIAQSLSDTVCKTILGVVIAYAGKSVVENVSKNGYVGRKGFTDIDKKGDKS